MLGTPFGTLSMLIFLEFLPPLSLIWYEKFLLMDQLYIDATKDSIVETIRRSDCDHFSTKFTTMNEQLVSYLKQQQRGDFISVSIETKWFWNEIIVSNSKIALMFSPPRSEINSATASLSSEFTPLKFVFKICHLKVCHRFLDSWPYQWVISKMSLPYLHFEL